LYCSHWRLISKACKFFIESKTIHRFKPGIDHLWVIFVNEEQKPNFAQVIGKNT
jgi:hypothetical protein